MDDIQAIIETRAVLEQLDRVVALRVIDFLKDWNNKRLLPAASAI